jgi:hypothetical protein
VIRIAPTGAVMRIDKMAVIKTVLAYVSYSSRCSFLTSSRATGPRAAWKSEKKKM